MATSRSPSEARRRPPRRRNKLRGAGVSPGVMTPGRSVATMLLGRLALIVLAAELILVLLPAVIRAVAEAT